MVLNFLRTFKPTEYKVSVLDYIHYNADVLGPLNVFSTSKNGLIGSIPSNEKELKQSVAMLAAYYRKVEGKIGSQNVYEYNKTHKPEERIPYRILIINRMQESFNLLEESEMAYVINNAAKFGISIIRMTKSTDGGSKGKEREKKYLVKATDYIRVISDASGTFYAVSMFQRMVSHADSASNRKFVETDFIFKVELYGICYKYQSTYSNPKDDFNFDRQRYRNLTTKEECEGLAQAIAKMTMSKMKSLYPPNSLNITVSHIDAEVTLHFKAANKNYVPPRDIY